MPWAIVGIQRQLFAIAAQDMREMLPMPETARLPDVPAFIRGVINLRGRVLPMVDLRKRLGYVSALDETESFCALMREREQDHRNWLSELELSVCQHRAFTLATDPHACKFGRWYDSYRPQNPWVSGLLHKFAAPHRKIHGIAAAVEEWKAAGKYDNAQKLIDQTRAGDLAKMIKLFSELRKLIRDVERETAVVLATSNRTFAVSVDEALSVERFPLGNIEEISPAIPLAPDGIVRRLARRAKSNEVVLILETDRLATSLGRACSAQS